MKRRRGPRLLPLAQRLLAADWVVRLADPLFGGFNPFHPEFRSDPYPTYHRLRREAPVFFSPVLRSWILTRHRDVLRVLGDDRFSVERERSELFRKMDLLGGLHPEFAEAVRRNLLMLDPPDHTRLRRLVSRAFTPRRIDALRPRVAALASDLLDAFEGREEVDLVGELAWPLPVAVIAELLGVPQADRQQFREWSDALTALLDPLQAQGGMAPAESAYFELAAYFREALRERRARPREDLLTALACADEEGDRLREAEVLSLCMLLLAAGHETTTNLLANAVLAFLRFPDQRRRLREDPAEAASAVEECLRYDSPVQLTDRVALDDVEIDGRTIRRGQLVGLLLGAANRDPEVFADPDRLDIGRRPNPHLAFGHGTHFCLGAHLARLEAAVALPMLLARFPHLDGDPDGVRYRRSMVLRGPLALPLRPGPVQRAAPAAAG